METKKVLWWNTIRFILSSIKHSKNIGKVTVKGTVSAGNRWWKISAVAAISMESARDAGCLNKKIKCYSSMFMFNILQTLLLATHNLDFLHLTKYR